jgi:hypothetical protein
MRIETSQGPERAIARLKSRPPEQLATFIARSLSIPAQSGEPVRTFILADDFAETTASLRSRIDALRVSNRRHSRHLPDEEMGQRLGYILDAIQSLIPPVSPATAFELLVLVIDRDGDAMQQCGHDHFCVETALKRAARLLSDAAKSMPIRKVSITLRRLIAQDGYGTRCALGALVSQATPG